MRDRLAGVHRVEVVHVAEAQVTLGARERRVQQTPRVPVLQQLRPGDVADRVAVPLVPLAGRAERAQVAGEVLRAVDDRGWRGRLVRQLDVAQVEHRGLKHRAKTTTRPVPVAPPLAELLARHIAKYAPADNGRLFVTRRGPGGRYVPTAGQPIPNNAYTTAWRKARKKALTAAQERSPLAKRPMTYATPACRRGSTLACRRRRSRSGRATASRCSWTSTPSASTEGQPPRSTGSPWPWGSNLRTRPGDHGAKLCRAFAATGETGPHRVRRSGTNE